MSNYSAALRQVHNEMTHILSEGVIPFWVTRGIDRENGGFLTSFDADGRAVEQRAKYLVTQTRMLWGFSRLYRKYGEEHYLEAARSGFRFLRDHFWDPDYGGWFWSSDPAGKALDRGKVVYGESFAIYALVEFAGACASDEARHLAEATFDLLQKYATDTRHGGYFENLEPDWQRSGPGFEAGDRKSLDIHMHLMEAFTELAALTGAEIHRRKLLEVTDVIVSRMIDAESGSGGNQYDERFQPIAPIAIRRTWNAERKSGERAADARQTTSYGHNIELVWLVHRACGAADVPTARYHGYTRRLAEHTLRFGVDREYGGVFRDGLPDGTPLVRDKEWWQNCESLVGFLDAYHEFEDERYLEAFQSVWNFTRDHLYNNVQGEFRQLTDRAGNVLAGDLGNPWKAFYHSGRALLESMARLEKL